MTAPQLLGPSTVRELARRYDVRPTKRWGQNFVVDANTVRRIVKLAGVDSDSVVLEVGPGLGSLTLGLLEVGAEVLAVEIDPVLSRALGSTIFRQAPDQAKHLYVINSDAMELTLASLDAEQIPGALVANLPYNVAVPVLLHLLAEFESLGNGLVMVQWEVAERLAAPPGSRTYGVPSVKAAWYAEVTQQGRVPRSVFWPVPNVDSGLVSFRRRPPPRTSASRADVFACVDAAFAQRRKSLRSALADWAGSKDAADAALVAAGIDPALRGERLDIEQFAAIAEQRQAART
ncbi:MAG TPA: 16S rRNA (adenine(1518)-N(6)/adenine(1519)-N(6))-dimethyltransferase RsmA [Actinomycetes bacterium]|nr:16S rRNA (adenine(1518)-N(6)/adenine(1519)-N(6))-dimethyltransferase RsmA [Actinomycetes bacterium]